jgi:putative transcription factor
MEHQDWEPVVWTKKKTKKDFVKEGKTSIVRKHDAGLNKKTKIVFKKSMEDGEYDVPETVSLDLKLQIQQARMAKKLSQKMLAQMISEHAGTIQSYENGTAIPNPAVLSKISKALGIHFAKKPKGKRKK